MKLYHFLSEKWALEAVRTQIIKVSKYDELNDPFELLAMSLEDKASRVVMKETKEKINKILRILCCSKYWDSPLLWGHYADKHKGIALELEVPRSLAQKVKYSKNRTAIDLRALMKKADNSAKLEMLEMYMTKYDQWSYENEYRIKFMKSECVTKGKFDFIHLNSDIKITGLVLGPLNDTPKEKIENNIPIGKEIKITTTRVAFRSFNIVHQQKIPPYKLVGKH